MARPAFAEIVRDAQRRGRLILMDGPMGTELVHSGIDLSSELTSEWNLSRPETVKVVYEDYTNAGAEVLVTNTFSSHLAFLRGDADWREQVQAALDLARQPEWDHLYCVGSVGSAVGSDADTIEAMEEVIQTLSPCDAILLETQNRLDRVKQLLGVVPFADQPDRPAPPWMVSFSFCRLKGTDESWVADTINGASLSAQDIATWADGRKEQLFVLGVNCGTNLRLADFESIIRGYRERTDLPLLLRPGITPTIEAEFTPREYAEHVRAFADAGVTLLGGCCGATPAHIAALRKEIDRLGLGWQDP